MKPFAFCASFIHGPATDTLSATLFDETELHSLAIARTLVA